LVDLAHGLHEKLRGGEGEAADGGGLAGGEGEAAVALAEEAVEGLLALEAAIDGVDDLAVVEADLAGAVGGGDAEDAAAAVHGEELEQVHHGHLLDVAAQLLLQGAAGLAGGGLGDTGDDE